MKGRDEHGEEVEVEAPPGRPEKLKPKPRRPLKPDEVKSLQETIASGLLERGYCPLHVSQVLNQPRRTASRRARPPTARPPGI